MIASPQSMPVTPETLNYAPVVFGACLIFVCGWWFISARKNWTGIKKLISDEELYELEAKMALGGEDLKIDEGILEVCDIKA